VCATTTVQQTAIGGTAASPTYPYTVNVVAGSPDECKVGAVVTFMVGTALAGQTSNFDDVGSFFRVDLTAPGTPNVPAGTAAAPVSLARGCTEVTSTFPNGAQPSTIAAAVSPVSALAAIWRFDTAATIYRGYSPAPGAVNDLGPVNSGDKLRICVTAAATLTTAA
jgi:hypothetical protein